MLGRLLLVEDEKALSAILVRYLERAGYQVDSCETGQGALERASASPGAYDAIILDLNLPDLPGEQVLQRLLELAPRTRVLISSGTPFAVESLAPAVRARVRALLKPFVPKMLDEALRGLMGG